MVIIFPFGEGKTEKIVFEFLVNREFQSGSFRNFVSVGGKNSFKDKILKTVQGDLKAERDEIRIIAFRDLDAGEQVDGIVQSFQNIVWELLRPWMLRPKAQQIRLNTIYMWEAFTVPRRSGLRLVLHIANHENSNLPISLQNQTADGYILRLGLTDQVLSRFAQESKVSSNPNSLYELVTSAIPSAITHRGISFDEDKDYLAAYLTATRFWVVKRTEEKSLLVRIILEWAWKYNREHFNQVFASWYTAIKEVIR